MTAIELPLPIVQDEQGNNLEAVWIGVAFMRVKDMNGLVDRIISFERYLELYYKI